jgi:surface antigen
MKKTVVKQNTIFSVVIVIIICSLTIAPVYGWPKSINNSMIEEDPIYSIFLPIIAGGSGSGEVIETIGDVEITIKSPVMPDELIASNVDDANQLASAFSLDPFEEISIISIAYGESSPIEQLPTAIFGGASTYRDLLAQFRESQGGTPTDGPSANLFYQYITSSYSIVPLQLGGEGESSTLIVEWVVDALDHLWIIRISKDVSNGNPIQQYLSNLENLTIVGTSLSQDKQSFSISSINFSNDALTDNTLSVIQNPGWWNGYECDLANYSAITGINSFGLGTSYDGLIACGPRPYIYQYGSAVNPGPLVRFFDGAHGQYEWQCVELAMRYLYLKYGISPYQGNGKDVVNNYSGNILEVVWNGTTGKAPQPGDVISFGASSQYGHVAIVVSSSVNSSGNGQIGIMEQNASASGYKTLSVSNWKISGSLSAINWLTEKTSPPITNPITNPDFELDTGWTYFDTGEYWQGGYSQNWSNKGSRSYILHIPSPGSGCYNYPGDNTYSEVYQFVDLSDISTVIFDLKTFGAWDVPELSPDIYHSVEVWIGNTRVYIRERQVGVFLNQSFSVTQFSGTHKLVFRMQGHENFCSSTDRGLYIDNIRVN